MSDSKYVSIMIVHYAQTDVHGTKGVDRSTLMKESLESLFANTDYPAEILVADNGGNPDDTDWLVQKTREGKINTLVRYKENTQFAFSWNQLARIATGDYLLFTCNDIKFKPGWLSSCVNLLEKYKDRKLIASPFITPDKNRPNFNKEVLEDARINSMAGSNCMLMRREDWLAIGEFPHHRIGGSVWHRIMVNKGYMVIIPPVDMVEHLAWRKGINWRKPAVIKRTLLNGEEVDFSLQIRKKSLYNGWQRDAGIKL